MYRIRNTFCSLSFKAVTHLLLAFPFGVMAAQVSLSGQVIFSNGNPVIGVTIAIPTMTGQKETQTDAVGNFSFSIEEGSYDHLRVRNMGSAVAGIPHMMEYVAVTPLTISGNTVKNVTLPALYKVEGHLKTPTGTAVANAHLTLQKWDGNMTQLPSDQATTGTDGAYSLIGFAGQVKLTVPISPDSAFASFQSIITLTKDTTIEVEYTTAPRLSGTVRTAQGQTIAGIVVALVKDGTQTEKRTNASGAFSFVVSQGTVSALRVRAMSDTLSQVPANLEYTAFENFTVTGDLTKDITLPQYPLFSGRLLSSGGQGLAKFKVSTTAWIMNMRQPPSDYAVTDSLGRFQLRCALGSNQMVIDPDSTGRYAKEIRNFSISSDSSAEIALVRGGMLTGRVLFANKKPVSGITVALSNGLEQKETQTDGQGSFTMVLQPGKYADFRIRSMMSRVQGIPKMLEHTVKAGGITLVDSLYQEVVLPPFHSMAGKVLDASLKPVSGVTVQSSFWSNGMTQLPSDECLSGSDGAYEIFMPEGTNWVTVRPPTGSSFATTSFNQKIDTALSHNILLADQAKGIASIQPSVAGQGKSGKISIIGINTTFLTGVTAIDLGEGITVSGITAPSGISVSAQIQVSDSAQPGVRSVRVITAKESYAGGLFTVTAPVSSPLLFDAQGKITKTVVIEDGTGTSLKVDSGTRVSLPTGAEKALSFDAPLIKNDQVNPPAAEFLQVQREFSPAGVVFDPPASLTFHYQDQDMKGVDESTLKSFKYDNKSDTVVAEYKVTARDTAKNIIKQEVSTFSLFRLAKSKTSNSIQSRFNINTGRVALTRLQAQSQPGAHSLRITYTLSGKGPTEWLRFRLFNLKGETLEALTVSGMAGMEQTLIWPLGNATLLSGLYPVELEVAGKRILQTVMIGN